MEDFVIEGKTLVKYDGYKEWSVIPDGITEIGYGAFKDCDFLKKVYIPKSVKIIGNRAFEGCEDLKKIYILDKMDRIGDDAFRSCISLKEVVFFGVADEIGGNAFEGTPWLAKLRKKKGCVVVGDVLIDGKTYSDNSALRIMSGIKKISPYAFEGNTNLMKVTFEEGVRSIGSNAFGDCSNLFEVIIPSSITQIGSDAFSNTLWLDSKRTEDTLVTVNGILIDTENCNESVITTPPGISTIGEMVFGFNDNLTKVDIRNGVKKICYGAFCDCKSLQSVTIPDSVVEFEEDIFDGSDNVRVTYKGKSYTGEEFDNMRRQKS